MKQWDILKLAEEYGNFIAKATDNSFTIYWSSNDIFLFDDDLNLIDSRFWIDRAIWNYIYNRNRMDDWCSFDNILSQVNIVYNTNVY